MGSLLREYLNAPQKQDETSCVSRNSNEENIIDGENGSHNDKMAGIDAYTPNAVASNGCVEKVSKCSDEKIDEDFEVTRESKEGVLPIDHMKETTDCSFVPNERLDHQMADIKSSPSVNQENAIAEANGTSATPSQQFKDVVVIVDPPRVGLHPVVSNNPLLVSSFFSILPVYILQSFKACVTDLKTMYMFVPFY